MRIKEIELDNFKSFGEKTIIPLLDGFTAISGPNGSGKSNVIDSLMFALGLTTTRNMRAERLTDLLNNISGRTECSVRVVFLEDASAKEIEIQRKIKVKKEGYDSKYTLNGQNSTLTAIHDELGKYNISPKGFNVVMQGDVISIISMNSIDRRKIIDEIAGVADFDRKIELANKELELVLERIDGQEIILQEIKERLDQLQGERDQAIKYAELKQKRTELERQFLNVRIKQLRSDDERTSNLLEELKERKINLQVESNTINEGMQNFQQELNNLAKKINELGEDKQRELGLQREDKRDLIAREESALAYLQKQIDDHKNQQNKWEKEIKNLKQSMKNIDFKAQEFSDEMLVVKRNIEEEKNKYSILQVQIKEKSESSNIGTQTVISSQDRITKYKEAKANLQEEKARLEEKQNHLNENLDKYRSEAERLSERLNELQRKASGFMQLDALKEQIAFQSRTLQSLKDEQRGTQEEISNQQNKLRKVEKDLSQIEGQEQAASAAGFGRAVEMVLNIDGVHGTLAQLGTVEGECQLAVETAAGARLRAVVVDDDLVAQECIDFLREKKAGRATFLPLNKIKESRDYPLPNDQGVIGWAIDLVGFQEEYRNAFSYAFADTLVVKNLEVARRMIGRYRMVTIQGDLVERSGAMTGGAAIKSSIHFGADSDKQKERLESSKAEIESFIEKLQAEYRDLETQIENTRIKIEEQRSNLSKLELDTGTSSHEIKTIEELYEKSKSSLIEESQSLNQVEEKIENLNNKIFLEEQKISEEEKSLAELAREMKDSGLEHLVQESQVIEVEIKRYESMLNNIINESKSLEIEKNFSMQSIDRIEAQMQASLSELSNFEEAMPEHQNKILSLNEDLKRLEEEINLIKQNLSEMQNQRDSISNELLELGQRKGSVISQIETTAIKIVETRKQLTSIKEHLVQLEEELKEHPELEGEEISEEDLGKLQLELNKVEKKMRSMEPINMRAVEEYEEVHRRESEIIEKQKSLSEERLMLINKIDSYRNDKKSSFMKNFLKINDFFQEIFADLSFGLGQLILEDPDEVFNGGLIIKAQPRGKKMQRLEAMSGGEKSLTALSFLFALQQCNPAPFYAFDEVDSALDGVNVDRLAHKIRKNSFNTQFVVVTHRRPMLEQSDRAVGVSVNKKGFSKVIGVKNIKAEELGLAAAVS